MICKFIFFLLESTNQQLSKYVKISKKSNFEIRTFFICTAVLSTIVDLKNLIKLNDFLILHVNIRGLKKNF